MDFFFSQQNIHRTSCPCLEYYLPLVSHGLFDMQLQAVISRGKKVGWRCGIKDALAKIKVWNIIVSSSTWSFEREPTCGISSLYGGFYQLSQKEHQDTVLWTIRDKDGPLHMNWGRNLLQTIDGAILSPFSMGQRNFMCILQWNHFALIVSENFALFIAMIELLSYDYCKSLCAICD